MIAPALLLASACVAAVPRKAAETTPWQVAEAARAQLAQIPPGERTGTDYRTVMDAYRLIYHANPGDLHAPESIFQVGNLLAEEGIVLHDPHALQESLGQYEFLRRQYPTSSLRISAALEEAHVAVAGLHDAKLAREKYTDFLTEFPRSQRVPEAREALAALKAGRMPQVTSGPLAQTSTKQTAAAQPDAQSAATTMAQASSSQAGQAPNGTAQIDAPSATATSRGNRTTQTPPALQTAARFQTEAAANSNGVAQSTVAPSERAEASQRASERTATQRDAVIHAATNPEQAATDDTPASAKAAAHTKSGLAQVTGIRHWSTPTYTRVAIDLGDQVQYEAARVPNPDRIYFDLHGTRLAPELQGKLLNVVDDGFLKRVRIAQYTADSTRVVLDVNDVTEYSAFLLPNPYRLIIDIHGGAKTTTSQTNTPTTNTAPQQAKTSQAAPVTRTTEPVMGDNDGGIVGDAPTPSSPAPRRTSSLATTSRANTDVASLSKQPGKVDATDRPTTQPIAVVADRRGGDTETPATAHKVKRALAAANSPEAAPDASSQRTADLGSNRAAAPTTEGQRSLMRALGLKIGRIVIDPGHGGHDSGTLGADGIMEKDVVLDVALRLGKLLHDHLGAEIIYTRSDDTFIPLETRTAIANKAQADLFLSIHANSSKDETARGVETYYLNFTSDPTALDVAARENAVSDQSVSELSTMVKKITLKDKIDESREFAQDVEQSLYTGLERGNAGLKNRGVKKAPFVVLIGANMPSILTEISFVTNPDDAAKLRTGDYRERVAESIYKGVARYAQGLGGMRVASTTPAKSNSPE
ncbi:N-acetylmuramoyl-L-alanine amidase [Terriglobus aquaticus]|uniref:N-acetylmuramoyl-L-alanine amidase n=1 Tax=Terriglobus aquaticus TaxID=940139 RepID=UPI0021E0BCD6|nr:N-acetylmuramoyl-L-alanine amidase [Terriglobus aquaticus]